MSGGTAAIIIACLLVLLVVAAVFAAIAFMFKYGMVIVPTMIIAKIFGDRHNKKRK